MTETIVLCTVLSINVFGIQSFLCLKANKKTTKLIPAYIIVAIYVIAALLFIIDILDGSGGVAIWIIFAFIISVANTVAFVADILAWLIVGKSKKI